MKTCCGGLSAIGFECLDTCKTLQSESLVTPKPESLSRVHGLVWPSEFTVRVASYNARNLCMD